MNTVSKEDRQKFGKLIKETRIANGLNAKDLGELIGKTHHIVSHIERGIRFVTRQEFKILCDLLNLNPDSIFPNGVPFMKEDKVLIDTPKNSRYKGRNYDPKKDKALQRKLLEEQKKDTVKKNDPEQNIKYDIEQEFVNADKDEVAITTIDNIPADKDSVTWTIKRKVSIKIPTKVASGSINDILNSIVIEIEEQIIE